jgi:hypothetical protein
MKFCPRLVVKRSKAISAGMLLALTFLGACRHRTDVDDESHQNRSNQAPAPAVSLENGQTVLTLDSHTQNRLGLEIATLTASVSRRQMSAPAAVLSGQDLTTARNSYVAAQAQLQKSRVEEGVANKEYARLKALFDENQNISQKSLQAAEGTVQASEADVNAGQQQLELQQSVLRQEWGRVVTEWVVEGSPDLQGIFDQREVLVQMTMPSNLTFRPPRTISLEIPDGERTEAHFISPFPRIDPRIQGSSYLYLVSARSGLSPGVNLIAWLSIGNQIQGVIVPASAIVWSDGLAWVYQQTAADRFARRALGTDTPVEKGFFVSRELSPGDRIVTQGAQALLSEELLVHTQGGEESDEN